MKKFILTSFFVFFLGLTAFAQCPMCKTALKSNQDGAAGKPTVGNGINSGILFLLSTPYVLLSAAGLVWYNSSRKKKQDA